MVLAEYGGGYQGYSTNGTTSTRSRSTARWSRATYFLTGEQLTRRVNVVRPITTVRLRQGQVRPRRRRGPRPLQRAGPRQAGLHRRLRRPEPVDQPRLRDRHRRELVLELLHQDLLRLAARRCSATRSPPARRPPAELDRPVLAPVPGLLLRQRLAARLTFSPAPRGCCGEIYPGEVAVRRGCGAPCFR